MLLENGNGLGIAACATQSRTTAERAAALALRDEMGLRPEKIPRADQGITLGADQLDPERKLIAGLRQRRVVPQVAAYEPSAHGPNFLTAAERNDAGFAIRQKKRQRVARVCGWGRLDSVRRKIKLHGLARVDWVFRFLATAHNVVRRVKWVPAP